MNIMMSRKYFLAPLLFGFATFAVACSDDDDDDGEDCEPRVESEVNPDIDFSKYISFQCRMSDQLFAAFIRMGIRPVLKRSSSVELPAFESLARGNQSRKSKIENLLIRHRPYP